MLTPLQETLAALHARFQPLADGEVATYIPELGRADPDNFAVSVATVDGHVYDVGNADTAFTIQSISKPFLYGLALQDLGPDAVTQKVGVEPSGEAFNAISLEADTGRPRNPMINAGAIATASLIAGRDSAARMTRTIRALSSFAGRPLCVDEAVYESERDTGHRNRAIAYMLRNAGIVGEDVDEVLDRYFRQCSVLVTARDLAAMAATLANGGTNPVSGDRVLAPEHVERVLSVMSMCGMYDYAGSWIYRVGMPAKSGVSGGIIAVLPGQLGIGVFSPPLDSLGNSVRGIAVCEALSQDFGLHLLRPPVSLGSVVLMSHSLKEVSSTRRRSDPQLACLAEHGDSVRVLRLQGPLVLATAEVALRAATECSDECTAVVLDCRRVSSADAAACRLVGRFAARLVTRDVAVSISGLRPDGEWERMIADAARMEGPCPDLRFFDSLDLALEWAEDRVLGDANTIAAPDAEIALRDHPFLASLSTAEAAALGALLTRADYDPGASIIRQGAEADSVFLLTAGSVSINLSLPDGRRHRLATMGPGAAFGELALLDTGPRAAAVEAETVAVCYMLPTSALPTLDITAPGARLKLLERIALDLGARLRRADTEIMALAH